MDITNEDTVMTPALDNIAIIEKMISILDAMNYNTILQIPSKAVRHTQRANSFHFINLLSRLTESLDCKTIYAEHAISIAEAICEIFDLNDDMPSSLSPIIRRMQSVEAAKKQAQTYDMEIGPEWRDEKWEKIKSISTTMEKESSEPGDILSETLMGIGINIHAPNTKWDAKRIAMLSLVKMAIEKDMGEYKDISDKIYSVIHRHNYNKENYNLILMLSNKSGNIDAIVTYAKKIMETKKALDESFYSYPVNTLLGHFDKIETEICFLEENFKHYQNAISKITNTASGSLTSLKKFHDFLIQNDGHIEMFFFNDQSEFINQYPEQKNVFTKILDVIIKNPSLSFREISPLLN